MKLSATVKEAVADVQVEISQEEGAEARLGASRTSNMPKTAVLNSLTSVSGQRTYDHAIREFVAWYCSEPRLAFNRTVVLRVPHSPRTTQICACHDQSSARGRPADRVRGRRRRPT